MTTKRCEPQDTAFHRALTRNPLLLPQGRSVAAFVAWVRSHGTTGEVLQEDVYMTYAETCDLMGVEPMALKHFGRALRKAGFPPYQADKIGKDGKRWRPMAVNLSSKASPLALVAAQAHQRVTSAVTAKPAKPPFIPMAKAA